MKTFLIMTLLMLSGCASVPPILETPEDTALVSYEEVVMNQTAKDAQARWGGVIAQVENNPDGSVIEIVHYPLKANGRPNLSKASIGRFKVFVDGFIDPLVFKQERVVSVLGTVGDPVEGTVSEQVYIYPSIYATGYYLWEDVEEFEYSKVQVTPFFRFGHGFGFDLGFPYYRSRHHGIYRESGRIRVRSGNTQSGAGGTNSKQTLENIPNRQPDSTSRPKPTTSTASEHNRKYAER